MNRPRVLSADAVRFRRMVLDSLWDDARFGYIDADRFVGTCPVCAGAVVVRFAGIAPRATIECEHGCSEAEIAARLGLEATS